LHHLGVDGDAPIMTTFLSTASITLQLKTIGFRDPIDAVVVGRLRAKLESG